MSDDILTQILARVSAIEAGQSSLRADLMERMDRQQDIASQQSRDVGAILELLGGQQQAASDATQAAHGASKTAQSTASVATDLLKRVRQLESDFAVLQAKLRGEETP